jgi:DNA polymerase I-like protein with 3'-5' exonuclease and polymerase domains
MDALGYLGTYRAIWLVDFEFCSKSTHLPDVVCVAAQEILSGRRFALWRDELGDTPPYDIGDDAVVVFYSGMEAELACHLTLGWPLPEHCIDLIAEYSTAVHGLEPGKVGFKMLEACARFEVETYYSQEEKDRIRKRIMAGWPFSKAEREEILEYCACDTAEEAGLLMALPATARSFWAVHRGDFIKAVARMWFRGVPIDPLYMRLAHDDAARATLRESIINDLQDEFPVWEGLTLKNSKLDAVLTGLGVPIPRTPKSGLVSTENETLQRLAQDHPVLNPLIDGLHTLGQLKDFDLPIGDDHRLRAWFAPFMTKTSRAAPPTNAYIYNLPAWFRATMQPPEGYALAYLDWSAMEFALAAVLSGCTRMQEFYHAPCPYLAAAIAFGMLPATATRQSHPIEREMFKTGLLSAQYGVGAETLARHIKRSVPVARELIRSHHKVFRPYWKWSDAMVSELMCRGIYRSRLGWECHIRPASLHPWDRDFNTQALRNIPIQTTGADIMRTAVIFADQLDIGMIATAHDAVLLLELEEEIEEKAAMMALCMRRAGELLLNGFELRVKPEILKPGSRFIEERGRRTFEIVDRFLRGKDERTHR